MTFLNFDDFFPTIFIFSFFQVLASECCDISYNDLDLIFTVDLPTQKHYERVSGVVKLYLYLYLYLYFGFVFVNMQRGRVKVKHIKINVNVKNISKQRRSKCISM